MTENKQIEEMAKIIQNGEIARNRGDLDCTEFLTDVVIKVGLQRLAGAKALYNADYRKASEVAREIFEEIESAIDSLTQDTHQCVETYKSPAATPFVVLCEGKLTGFDEMRHILAELKKKYTESEKK